MKMWEGKFTSKQIHKHTDRKTNEQTNIQHTDRQINIHTDKHTDRQHTLWQFSAEH